MRQASSLVRLTDGHRRTHFVNQATRRPDTGEPENPRSYGPWRGRYVACRATLERGVATKGERDEDPKRKRTTRG